MSGLAARTIDPSAVAVIESIGSAVVHFLWQAAALGVLAGVLLVILPKHAVEARYGALCLTMLLGIAAFCGSFVVSFAGHASAAATTAASLSVPQVVAVGVAAGEAPIGRSASLLDAAAWLCRGRGDPCHACRALGSV